MQSTNRFRVTIFRSASLVSTRFTRHSEQTISTRRQTLSVDPNCFKSARLRRVYKFLQHHFLPLATSPSRRCQRRANAFKCLFPLRFRRAHFNHNYSPLICRFLSRPVRLICHLPSLPADQLTRCSALQLLKQNLILLRPSSLTKSVSSLAVCTLLVPLHPSPHNACSTCAAARLNPSVPSQQEIRRLLAASGANRVAMTFAAAY